MYFLGKHQGGFVDVSAIFKNSDMYWGRMFWEALQFRSSSLKPVPVMENTLTWQVQAKGIFPEFPANNYLTEITTRRNGNSLKISGMVLTIRSYMHFLCRRAHFV